MGNSEGSNNGVHTTIIDKFKSNLLQVGEFVVDFQSGRLWKDGEIVGSISRKPLRILEILILNNDRYLSNAELHAIFSNHAETVDAVTRQHIKKMFALR